MDIRIFEAGKPPKERSVDASFTLEAGKLSIGGGAPCEVIVPGLPGAPQAEVHVDGARCEIRNVGNGSVEVAGKPVPPGNALTLGPEVLMAVGGKELVFRATPSKSGGGGAAGGGGGGPRPVSDRPSYLAKDVLKEVFQVLGVPENHPVLVVYDADGNVIKRLDLAPPEEEATIGRHPENRLVLYHASVSKNHARVLRDGMGFIVKDLESRNGTQVNGQPVKGMHRLKSGDQIQIGAFTIRFVDPKAAVEDLASSVPDLRKIEKAAPGEKVVVGYDEKENPKGFFHQTSAQKPEPFSVGGETASMQRPGGGGAAGGAPGAESASGEAEGAPAAKSNKLIVVLILVGLGVFGAMVFLILQAMKTAPGAE